ncbi:Bax inhibitor-1 family protein [Fulvivirgaceae bacterium BMA10]|uniref:Bax inhibitor-1 family protein n=1 Tax=Splendidivirga corallicola TaxID=3051826 RepID=A0ABT8KJ89_9BACT|nr:Bax inhibitor-1 family protein [Fulvivirgaceae bacterium BMA10]
MNETQSHFQPLNVVSESEKAEFIRQTYLHVTFAVLGFVVLELILFQTGVAYSIASLMLSGQYTWLIVLGGFMFVSYQAEKWARSSTSKQMQYAGLFLYTLGEAIIFVPLLMIAASFSGGELIQKAALMTIFLFVGLTIVVFTTKKDFSFLRNVLVVGGFVAMGLIVLGIIFGFELGLFFSFAMVALAAGSILYQTSNLIHHYQTGQHVAAALALFASLMLLFWYILRIFIALSDD